MEGESLYCGPHRASERYLLHIHTTRHTTNTQAHSSHEDLVIGRGGDHPNTITPKPDGDAHTQNITTIA